MLVTISNLKSRGSLSTNEPTPDHIHSHHNHHLHPHPHNRLHSHSFDFDSESRAASPANFLAVNHASFDQHYDPLDSSFDSDLPSPAYSVDCLSSPDSSSSLQPSRPASIELRLVMQPQSSGLCPSGPATTSSTNHHGSTGSTGSGSSSSAGSIVNGEHTPELTSPELSYDLRRLIAADRNSDAALIATDCVNTNTHHHSYGGGPTGSANVLAQLPLDELLTDDLLDQDKFEQITNNIHNHHSHLHHHHHHSLNSQPNLRHQAMHSLVGLNSIGALNALHPTSASDSGSNEVDVQLHAGFGAFANERSTRQTYQLQRLTIKAEPDDPLEMNSCSPHSNALYSPGTQSNTPFANYSSERHSLKFGHLLANGKPFFFSFRLCRTLYFCFCFCFCGLQFDVYENEKKNKNKKKNGFERRRQPKTSCAFWSK